MTCTYTDGDADDDNSADGDLAPVSRKSSGDNKKVGPKKPPSAAKAGIVGTANPAKVKEKKLEEERDLLKLKIGALPVLHSTKGAEHYSRIGKEAIGPNTLDEHIQPVCG